MPNKQKIMQSVLKHCQTSNMAYIPTLCVSLETRLERNCFKWTKNRTQNGYIFAIRKFCSHLQMWGLIIAIHQLLWCGLCSLGPNQWRLLPGSFAWVCWVRYLHRRPSYGFELEAGLLFRLGEGMNENDDEGFRRRRIDQLTRGWLQPGKSQLGLLQYVGPSRLRTSSW